MQLKGPIKRGDGIVLDRGRTDFPSLSPYLSSPLFYFFVYDISRYLFLICLGNPEEQEEGGAVYEVLDSKGRPIPKGEEVDSGTVTISFGRSACDIGCYIYSGFSYLAFCDRALFFSCLVLSCFVSSITSVKGKSLVILYVHTFILFPYPHLSHVPFFPSMIIYFFCFSPPNPYIPSPFLFFSFFLLFFTLEMQLIIQE